MPIKKIFVFIFGLFLLSCEFKPPKMELNGSMVQDSLKDIRDSRTQHAASQKLTLALKAAVGESVRVSRIALEKNKPTTSDYLKEGEAALTVFFSSNIHGERIDCGCRKHPLGGLARHEGLVRSFTKENEMQEDNTAIFVDAGDSFFKNLHEEVFSKGKAKLKSQSLYDARTIALAKASMSYDVQNIGEFDLVYGVKILKELVRTSGKVAISANLFQDGKRVFPAYSIVEGAGKKIAFIGLTKAQARKKNFYKERNIEVKNPERAFRNTLKDLPEVDVVILLSNLGVPTTQNLLRYLKGPLKGPDIVLVSNSNRLTQTPVFEKGIPILEAGGRGKYFGKLDLVINGKDIKFVNSGDSKLKKLDNYARTYRNYLSARIRYYKQFDKIRKSLAYSKVERANNKHAHLEGKHGFHTHGDAPKHSHYSGPRGGGQYMRNVETLQKQMESLADQLMKDVAAISVDSNILGDDFFEVKMLPVELALPENKKVKKLIKKRERKRPKF